MQDIFARNGVELMCADNVFPDVDVLQIEPVRALIHEVFNQHIVTAPGMARLTELSTFETSCRPPGRCCWPLRSSPTPLAMPW